MSERVSDTRSMKRCGYKATHSLALPADIQSANCREQQVYHLDFFIPRRASSASFLVLYGP